MDSHRELRVIIGSHQIQAVTQTGSAFAKSVKSHSMLHGTGFSRRLTEQEGSGSQVHLRLNPDGGEVRMQARDLLREDGIEEVEEDRHGPAVHLHQREQHAAGALVDEVGQQGEGVEGVSRRALRGPDAPAQATGLGNDGGRKVV